jgi:hypothetical protein
MLIGLVAGLAACFIIFYWFYRLKSAMAEEGLKNTFHLLMLIWIAAFISSATRLMRMLTVIQEESAIDIMLSFLYT